MEMEMDVFWAYLLLMLGVFLFLLLVLLLISTMNKRLQLEKLRGKTILITGCDTGFGFDLVLKCVSHGMDVFAACLTEQGCTRVADSVKVLRKENENCCSNGGRVRTLLLDVTSQKSVDSALEFVEKELDGQKGLYALVNNAGILGNVAWDDWLNISDYEQTLQVNTLGVIRVTHAFLQLIKVECGRVVLMSSVCGKLALPAIGPYTVSKFALEAYCDTLRTEMIIFGVTVSLLSPGFFKTPLTDPAMNTRMFNGVWSRARPRILHEYGQQFFEYSRDKMVHHLNMMSSSKVNRVVDAYFDAVSARWPKCRYIIGPDAYMFWLFSLLPTAIQHFFFHVLRIAERPPRPAKMGRELLMVPNCNSRRMSQQELPIY